MKNILLPAVAIAGLMLGSCSKDNGTVDTGTGRSEMTYELRATNASTNINGKSTATGTLVWSSGYAYPKEIKFEAKSNDTKIEYTSRNTARIDLFSSAPVGFGAFALPAGTYKEIELKIKLQDNGSDPALLLTGTWSDNLGTIPVMFIIEDDVELKTEMKNVTITDGSFAALTTLELATYTEGITGTMLRNAHLTNGTLIISRDSNRDLYNIITANLKNKHHKCDFEKD
jgi:hypothetical protein